MVMHGLGFVFGGARRLMLMLLCLDSP